MSQMWLKSSRKAKYYIALNISVCDLTIHWKKLKSSPRAQTITHAALKYSAYVSNVTENHQKGKYDSALNIRVCNIIIHWNTWYLVLEL